MSLKSNLDMLPLLGIVILVFIVISYNSTTLVNSYKLNNLNITIITLTGTLLGLLLTAYAILFGLVPALNREILELHSIEKINHKFLFLTITTLLTLIVSFIALLLNFEYFFGFIVIQMLLLTALFYFTFLILSVMFTKSPLLLTL
jgi:fatty acid desaturase